MAMNISSPFQCLQDLTIKKRKLWFHLMFSTLHNNRSRIAKGYIVTSLHNIPNSTENRVIEIPGSWNLITFASSLPVQLYTEKSEITPLESPLSGFMSLMPRSNSTPIWRTQIQIHSVDDTFIIIKKEPLQKTNDTTTSVKE